MPPENIFQLQEKLCFSSHINYNLQYNAGATALLKGIHPANPSSSYRNCIIVSNSLSDSWCSAMDHFNCSFWNYYKPSIAELKWQVEHFSTLDPIIVSQRMAQDPTPAQSPQKWMFHTRKSSLGPGGLSCVPSIIEMGRQRCYHPFTPIQTTSSLGLCEEAVCICWSALVAYQQQRDFIRLSEAMGWLV